MNAVHAFVLAILFAGAIGFPAGESVAILKRKKVWAEVESLHRQRTLSHATSQAPKIFSEVRSLRKSIGQARPLQPPILTTARDGLTLDPCSSTADCQGDRTCFDQDNNECTGSGDCTCIPPVLDTCMDNSSCDNGEACYAGTFCFSEDVVSGLPGIPNIPAGTGQEPGSGLTGDPCSANGDCDGDRECISASGADCDGAGLCFCVPSTLEFCTDDSDCKKGEECYGSPEAKICISQTVTETLPAAPESPLPSVSTGPSVVPLPSAAPSPGTGGPPQPTETPEPTEVATPAPSQAPSESPVTTTTETPDPFGPELSATPDTSGPEPSPGSDGPTPGETPGDGGGLLPGESPTTTDEELVTSSPTAGSESSENNEDGGDDDDAICIDARALSHLPPEELVFEQHNRAKVLCDLNGSCATPGHIVVYKGTAMRMSSYCSIVRCDRQSMLVNSPRYKRALRVPSKSEDLHFTAFAARYDTRAEEAVLTTAVHMGL